MIQYYFYNILLFIVLGFLEAILWHYSVNKISKTTARNLHIPLLAIRFTWFAWLFFSSGGDMASVSSLFLCHPLWHLGTMYEFRHIFNERIYKFGFLDTASSTSTSIMDTLFPQPFFIRLILFIVGTAFFFLWNLW
jgi:hypothetical protein